MKICVYAICKNEEMFVNRWYESVKDADYIVVLDTGSTDNTVKLLQNLNIKVESKIISPWRFDVARNESLTLIPDDTDLCICVDLDEVFDTNWREKIEKNWYKGLNKIRYNYNWHFNEYNEPDISFMYEKIHSPKDYKWVNPVHEVLEFLGEQEEIIYISDLTLNHFPDNNKSRSSYLPLLELAIKENPKNDRNMHYLGREYMYYERYNEAIDTLIKHLNLESATWKDERSASMRYISRCYYKLGRILESKMWLDKAIDETPYLRDPFVEKALLEYELNNYRDVIKYCNKALEIKKHKKTYINEIFSWNETIYDLLSVAYFYNGDLQKSYDNILIAININPRNKRLLNNKEIIKKLISNN